MLKICMNAFPKLHVEHRKCAVVMQFSSQSLWKKKFVAQPTVATNLGTG